MKQLADRFRQLLATKLGSLMGATAIITVVFAVVFSLRTTITENQVRWTPRRPVTSEPSPALPYRIFLPLLTRGSAVPPVIPPPPTRPFETGVWAGNVTTRTLVHLSGTGAKWTRIMMRWSEIEPVSTVPPSYNFSYYDTQFDLLRREGIRPIAEIRGNPAWASTTHCGPIDKAGGMWAFDRFLRAAVARYSQPAYNVKDWELYNEPDSAVVDPFMSGCWGDYPEQYTAMLGVAYEAIKATDPNASVLLGGLAFDSPEAGFRMDFLDRILGAGAAASFDVANVHYYSAFAPNWQASGPDIIGKVNATRAVMARYNVSKPLALTEVGWASTPATSPDFQDAQAGYVPKVMARAMSSEVYATVWFNHIDWVLTDYPYGLLDANLNQRLAYRAMQVASAELGKADFTKRLQPSDVDVTNGVEGYVFDVGGQERWVLWMNDQSGVSSLQIRLPSRSLEAKDKLGEAILLSSNQPTSVLLDTSPIYVRLGP